MSNWVVAKFGGSSVKDAEAMLRSVKVIESNSDIKIVVISATQNTTNQLEFIAQAASKGDEKNLSLLINELVTRHTKIAEDLYSSEEVRKDLNYLYEELRLISDEIISIKLCTPKIMDQLYSIGERISSLLMSDLVRLRVPEKNVVLLDARNIIKTNSEYQKAEPQIDIIEEKANELLMPGLSNNTLFVTQGFIGKDLLGNTTTLGREGSDYSAALFGEAIDASLVQIWTDVAGIASSDPRKIPEAQFIKTLSYDEATALASLGAKVLFPTTLLPTKRKNIPVFVGSSLNPEKGGTLITNSQDENFKLKAVTLIEKKEFSLISFIGCHLNLAPNLVHELKKEFKEIDVEFIDMTSVSLSYKVKAEDVAKSLIRAHQILLLQH
ncbi:MAG: aspartate kinase [Bacteriovoracaceae bacterium]|nr:aspartate kinase [Bacteriovoracaceae bacterium]